MLAVEVSKLIPTQKVISLSSIIKYTELPWHYKLAGFFRLQKILPIYFFSKGNRFTHWIFGVKSAKDKEVLNQVFINLDKDFLYWALNAVLTWSNNQTPTNLVRIHGTKDKILPKRKNTKYDRIIVGGTHLMVLDKFEETGDAIKEIL